MKLTADKELQIRKYLSGIRTIHESMIKGMSLILVATNCIDKILDGEDIECDICGKEHEGN